MIDKITQAILEQEEDKKLLESLLEGYNLKCALCGRVITVVKDGEGPLSCCNQRMFVMSSNPPMEEAASIKDTLKGEVVKPDFQVPVGSVHFGPYDQPEAQQRQRNIWKNKETPKMESQLLKDMEIFEEASWEKKPHGWDKGSIKKFGKSLVKGGGTKKGFFDKCVKKMEGKVSNPEGFCASVKDKSYGSTYWRGKGKTSSEVSKAVKKHKNA
jgi:desulfoferrodoxin-like iron-binding protein